MLKKILAISGKPGLYKLISQGKNMFIVESLLDGKRTPTYSRDKIVSLGEIAMYTDEGEKPLAEVMDSVKAKLDGAVCPIDVKKTSDEELRAFMESVLPTYDRDRVRLYDIKKLISWYNLLVESGNADFAEEKPADTEAEKQAE